MMSKSVSQPFIELTAESSIQTDARKTHCDAWRKSGLSMSEYSRRTGLSVSSLSGWVKKFKGHSPTKLKTNSEQLLAPTQSQEMEVILLSGIRLRFRDISNMSAIVRLLKAVESCS